MDTSDLDGISAYVSDSDIVEFLYLHLSYVHVLARQVFSRSVGPWDSDDLAQESLLKLLLTLRRTPITSPTAYIKRVVHSQAIDIVRKHKPDQPLLTDE